MEKALLSTAYLAPIQYYTKLLKYKEVLIEVHENYPKQSYRNRCNIYGANGLLSLSIPVKKIQTKTKTKDIVIDYATNWQKLHWKSIESAYRASPYFEYYEDDFLPFYRNRYELLIDFNNDLQRMILDHIGFNSSIQFTDGYIIEELIFDDFRESIHPKKKNDDKDFRSMEYIQVFSDKYGFIPNLSIIDLLFNTGPDTLKILNGMIC
ncbi:MAG: hypothetical protein A2W99_13905 [Bacteroidetes bacterium GWF2_33_16]|nr:MAG: hypothetical protein A2X00_09205 [Bacteroidetes bacterium GWE2_32_14]OFY04596.1 MAG: hypothetical protein A2W99_13905 [Bacteroidetes bacterium GWF2_33_16]